MDADSRQNCTTLLGGAEVPLPQVRRFSATGGSSANMAVGYRAWRESRHGELPATKPDEFLTGF